MAAMTGLFGSMTVQPTGILEIIDMQKLNGPVPEPATPQTGHLPGELLKILL